MRDGLQDWIFPQTPLDKAKLRSLLAYLAQPTAAELPLSTTDRRKAQQWAIAANLLNEQGLTPEGQLVAQKDPYLEATVTDWLFHFYLSFGDNRLWHYVVYDFLPKHPKFNQDEILECCTQIIINSSKTDLLKSLKLILKSYTQGSGITSSKFLTQQKQYYLTGASDLSNPYLTGYILAKIWEQDFKARQAVLVNEIVDVEKGLMTILGISKEALLEQLDLLAKHEIIEQRSAKPHIPGTKPEFKAEHEKVYQVYRCWDSPIELLEKAYENDIATPNRPLIQSLGDILDNDDGSGFLEFLQWAAKLTSLEGGSNTIAKLAS